MPTTSSTKKTTRKKSASAPKKAATKKKTVTKSSASKKRAISEKHCEGCGKKIHKEAPMCPGCGFASKNPHDKNRVVAALLALFLGGIGIHRFYMGQIGLGFVYLLFCWTLIPGFVSFIEFIYFLCISDKRFAELCA